MTTTTETAAEPVSTERLEDIIRAVWHDPDVCTCDDHLPPAILHALAKSGYSVVPTIDVNSSPAACPLPTPPAPADVEPAEPPSLSPRLLQQLKHCADNPMRNLETFPMICREAYKVLSAFEVRHG